MTKDKKQKIVKLALAISIVGAFLLMFAPFLIPILLAAIFAFAIHPIVERVTAKRGYRRIFISSLIIGMLLLIALPVLLAIYKIYFYIQEVSNNGLEKSQLFSNLIHFKDHVIAFAHQSLERVGMSEKLNMSALSDNLFSRGGAAVAAVSTALVTQVPDFILSTVIFCLVLYFFLAESKQIKASVLKTNLIKLKDMEVLISLLQRSSYNTLISTLVIGLVQATIVATGGAVMGVGDFMIVFVLTFFVSFIPVIGAAPVAFLLAALAALNGNITSGIILLVVCAIAGTIDNILRPILVSSSEGDLNPLIALVAVIGAIMVFGFPGLLLGPVILGVAIKIIPALFDDSELDLKLVDPDSPGKK